MNITGGRVVSIACAVVVSTSCSPPSPDKTSAEATRPNLLLYVVDALRPDSLGCYGNEEVETPAIDALAREGVLFENAFAQSSWTRPSLASILTGLYPGAHGVLGRQHRLAESLTLLPEVMQQYGYRTGFITTNPNVGSFFGFDQGWDTLQELYERKEGGRVRSTELITTSDAVTTAAIDWIRESNRPFFLMVLAIDPHWPYEPPEPFDRYVSETASERERVRGLYHGEVAANDESFGKLLAGLRDRKLYDDTVIVFTSDHGEEFWEHGERGHGRTLYEESIRVPLVMRHGRTASVTGGQRIDRPVQAVDIMPTLLTLADLPIPSMLNGRPLVSSPAEPTPVFARLAHDGRNLAAIRVYPWKLIADRETGEQLLFNLAEDPAEQRPVTNEHHELAEQLATQLVQHTAQNLARRKSLREETVAPEAVPDDVRETLEALGYVQ